MSGEDYIPSWSQSLERWRKFIENWIISFISAFRAVHQVDQAMSVSIKVQKPGFEFPFERRNFVAEAWRDSVLIWGGFTDGLRAPHDP